MHVEKETMQKSPSQACKSSHYQTAVVILLVSINITKQETSDGGWNTIRPKTAKLGIRHVIYS